MTARAVVGGGRDIVRLDDYDATFVSVLHQQALFCLMLWQPLPRFFFSNTIRLERKIEHAGCDASLSLALPWWGYACCRASR